MLDRLFSSKTRVEILRLFFSNPDNRYYVRQIARELHRDISGIKRELDNRNAAIYAELKSIIAKTVGLQGTLTGSLSDLRGLRQAWMYSTNSHPPGEGPGPILMLMVGRVDLADLNDNVTRLEAALGREINYTVFDESEFQRRRADGDPFVTEVLGGRNILLIGRDDAV